MSPKAFWLKQLHFWHYLSAAISLFGLLVFAFTGITLNHAAEIEAKPNRVSKDITLSAPALASLKTLPLEQKANAPAARNVHLPRAVQQELIEKLKVNPDRLPLELSPSEVYIAMPRPGGDAWVSLDRKEGLVTYEVTKRGTISFLNDLHKGRGTGKGWALIIDVLGVFCVIFAFTGLGLMMLHAPKRPSTWPVTFAGILVPSLLLILFLHFHI